VNAVKRALPLALVASIALLAACSAGAQTRVRDDSWKPVVGMPGRDAVWVPTSHAMIDTMLDLAKVTPDDFVMDLGSGDGRAIIAAAKRGVRGRGVEFNPDLVEYSKRLAAEAGVADKAEFVQGDMYAADISQATVLALFLLPSNLEKLKPKFLALPAGSRIVANTFWMEGWEADETVRMEENCDSWCTAHLFIIPAKVDGTWTLPQGELTLRQSIQMISGMLTINGKQVPVDGRLRGEEISFSAGSAHYTGHVTGDRIEGTVKGGPRSGAWSASRAR
jgi:SAM-dependent methyltransferase